MTRAEERALVAYPPRYAKCIIFPETVGADFNTLQRKSYQEGYEQAEKDLELTWEDIKTIEQIIATSDWYDFEINGKLWSKEFYEEVLKRFKEAKKNTKTK